MEKIWLKSYPKGVPAEITLDGNKSLVDLIEDGIRKHGDKVAVHHMGVDFTYSQIDILSKNFAKYLQNHTNLKIGDRMAIMLPNVPQYFAAMFGAIRSGIVIVNTNPLYTEREMEHQLNDAGVKGIVILANFADKLQNILPKTKLQNIIVTEIGDMMPFPKRLIVNLAVKYIKKMVPPYSIPNALAFNKAMKMGAKQKHYQRPQTKGEDTAFLQYTGGTTGVAKGAMLTHTNILANVAQLTAWMKPVLEDAYETVITPLPLYHIFSLSVNCFLFFAHGSKNVLITNPRDMKGFIAELNKHKFSIMTGVNTLFIGLLNQPDFKTLNFSSLKVVVGGGMAVQTAVAEEWKKVTGCTLTEGYGLTESSPVICANPVDGNAVLGSIGLPMPSTEVKIMDDDMQEVAIGQRGEICAKGPQIMKGYWQRQDETDKTVKDGWLLTGDIGVMEESGYVRIVDRKKEMILVSGFNVYPNEVEDVVAMHPGVLEVAAIGVPDDKSHEAVKIFVVKRNENLTADEIKNFCKDKLTGYKLPRHVEFRTELPKTNIGKILRRELRDQEMAKTKK